MPNHSPPFIPLTIPESSQSLIAVTKFYTVNALQPIETTDSGFIELTSDTFIPPLESSLIQTTAFYIGSDFNKNKGERKRVRPSNPLNNAIKTSKKQLNSFFMYRRDKKEEIAKKHPDCTQTQISCHAAEMWNLEPETVRDNYRIKAFKARFEPPDSTRCLSSDTIKTDSGDENDELGSHNTTGSLTLRSLPSYETIVDSMQAAPLQLNTLSTADQTVNSIPINTTTPSSIPLLSDLEKCLASKLPTSDFNLTNPLGITSPSTLFHYTNNILAPPSTQSLSQLLNFNFDSYMNPLNPLNSMGSNAITTVNNHVVALQQQHVGRSPFNHFVFNPSHKT
jgi:hypothetical protein